MALVEISSYHVHWDIDGHFGNIQLNLSNNTSIAIGGQTPEEMMGAITRFWHRCL